MLCVLRIYFLCILNYGRSDTVKFFKRHSGGIFFCVSCVLLLLSLMFSICSFASYVSGIDHGGDSSGVASIDCGFSVNKGKFDSFINAPFIQQVTDSTRPVRMNSWAESVISVDNKGKSGLKYEYSFVFYLPENFAKSSMMQLVELKDGNYVSGDISSASRASRIYRLDDATGTQLVETTATADGIEIENDFSSLVDGGEELRIDAARSSAILLDGLNFSTVKYTYATYAGSDSSDNVNMFVCPVAFETAADMRYCRITVNIAREDSGRYVLEEGKTHHYLFRLVLRDTLRGDDLSADWAADGYWEKDDITGAFTSPLQTPSIADEYECRWAMESGAPVLGKDGNPMLEINENGSGNWKRVSIKDCVGVTSPCKINMVFTQTA